MREADAVRTLLKGWNPKWVAFLSERGMSPQDAEKLPRAARTSLNAEFICATMGPIKPQAGVK